MPRIGTKMAALLTGLLCLCTGCAKQPVRYEAQFLTLFDTVTTIVGYDTNREHFEETVRFLHSRLEEYHRLYDQYHDYEGVSNIKTVNDNAGEQAVPVDRRIIDLLRAAQTMYEKTDGRVNVAFGSVLGLWHDFRTRGINDPVSAALPPEDALRAAALHSNPAAIVIDETAGAVFLSDPELRLDVGAIAKGYAVERVCREAEEAGYGPFLLSVGGNVRAVGGAGAPGKPWRVGVQDPASETQQSPLHTVALLDRSLVTSGGYQRYYTVDGKRYHHIIDPQTLYPADYCSSVTVLAEDSGLADALSTALFNMPCEQGLELLARIPGAEALWIFADGSERRSPGFPLESA